MKNKFTRIIVPEEKMVYIWKFLSGELTSRQLGEKLNCSHTRAISIAQGILAQFYQDGLITIKGGLSK